MERIFDVEQQYPDTEFKKYIHVSKLGIDSRLYNSYEACPDTIRLIVNSLEVYPTDSVVDIGCGKGYAMYAMAQKPFSQIDGIEICPHLAETALHNLSAIFGKGDRRFHIYTEDAALFDKWDDYTYAHVPLCNALFRFMQQTRVLHELIHNDCQIRNRLIHLCLRTCYIAFYYRIAFILKSASQSLKMGGQVVI